MPGMADDTNLWERIEEGNRLLVYGQDEEAQAVYLDVWRAASGTGDHYTACAVAHMLGTIKSMPPEEKLRWHLASLEQADRVLDGRADSWYASIYLNLGHIHKQLGQPTAAQAYFQQAKTHTWALDDQSYAEALRAAIDEALRELEGPTKSEP